MNSRLDSLRRASGRALAGLALVAASMAPALAGDFTVTPVRIELSASQPNSVLRVINHGNAPVTIQTGLFAWSFQGEQDVFKENDDILVNPPLATLQPGATQYIRLGLRQVHILRQEQAYRMFIEEVPAPRKANRQGLSITTLTRISLPIFVQAQDRLAPARLDWQVRRQGAEILKIAVTNRGPRHVQLRQMVLRAPGFEPLITRNMSLYLLPGQSREWTVRAGRLAQAKTFSLDAKTDAQDVHETLPADPS